MSAQITPMAATAALYAQTPLAPTTVHAIMAIAVMGKIAKVRLSPCTLKVYVWQEGSNIYKI